MYHVPNAKVATVSIWCQFMLLIPLKSGHTISSFPVQSIKRVIDHRTVDLYSMFNEELTLVKKEFNRHNPTLPLSQPRYAGEATWARLLKRRIDVPTKVRIPAECQPMVTSMSIASLHHIATCFMYPQK